MNGYRQKYLVYLVIFWLGFSACAFQGLAGQKKAEDQSVHIVWAEPTGHEYAIFYSSKNSGEWSRPVKLSDNDKLNVTPAIVFDPTDIGWVVWAALEGSEIYLYYQRLRNQKWDRETKIDTGLSSNTSPTLLVDRLGTIWLAWAGNSGQNDEIFFSRWINGDFETPIQITYNLVPDVLPVLSMDETNRMPRIDWLQFCDSGNCPYYSKWTGDAWSEPSPVNTLEAMVGNATASAFQEKKIQIPSFVKTPQSVSVHIDGDSIQSRPLRLVPR
mgnify:FL=1